VKRFFPSLACALLLPVMAACRKTPDIAAAPGFVTVARGPHDPYDWRAIAPDGVAVALRVVPLGQAGDLAVWAHMVTLRLREIDGYALLATKDVRLFDGSPGTELVFGHDESGKTFVYRVRLVLAGGQLYLLEAGGAKEQMDRYTASVDWMLRSLRVN
jgi:hypothetical protein